MNSTFEQYLPQINEWKAEGLSLRAIARRLHVPDSTLRGALKRISQPVYLDKPTKTYEGIPATQPEAIKVVFEEARSLLPTLREMAQSWDGIKEMLSAYTQQKQLLEVSPRYQPYDGFYSCRLNNQLIQDIKQYATDHRLSQSELITVALQAYMGR